MKILILESHPLSYDSSHVFLQQLGNSLEYLGVEVVTYELNNIPENEDLLRQILQESYDAVIDMNSLLPFVELDESPYLALLNLPFFNIIVDHPMHLHLSLQKKIKQYYVISIDENHCIYLKKNYPHLAGVFLMNFGGILGENQMEMEERPYSILFPGTYTPVDYRIQQMDGAGEHLVEIGEQMLASYKKGDGRCVDELFVEMCHGSEEFLSMKMYKARTIDRYIRDWYRKQVISSLLEAAIPVHVVGFRWETYQGPGKEHLIIHPPCPYQEVIEMIGKSKIIINVQPNFIQGPHDRILNGMMNGSVVFTDPCQFVEEEFTPYENIMVYDSNSKTDIVEKINSLLCNPDKLKIMGKEGAIVASSKHTWLHRGKQLFSIMQDLEILK